MSEEFSAGVNILLQRMETHPEEFYLKDQDRTHSIRDPKWHSVMVSVMQVKFKENARGAATWLTEAEVDALFDGYSKIRRKAFDDHVMDTVLNPVGELSSDATTRAKMQSLQAQYAQQQYGQALRISTANNAINNLQGVGYTDLRGTYDVDTDSYTLRGASAAQAQAHAQHLAAHQEALINAYPYHSSQDPHPQQMPEGMLSRIAKRVKGLK